MKRFPFSFVAYETTGEASLIQVKPTSLRFNDGTFTQAYNSGSGQVTAAKVFFAGSGCSAADYAGIEAGSIALTMAGDCFVRDKAGNASASLASALLVQSLTSEPVYYTAGPTMAPIPVFSVSDALGVGFRLGNATLSLKTAVGGDKLVYSENLCAETSGGSRDSVVVIGAHLDGVEAGAGINDNGSGSATVLELAIAASKLSPIQNRLRFCWWGAEELGLLGSHAYVNGLTAAERNVIKAYLNFDMLGSRNFISFIFNGTSAPEDVRNASATLTSLFVQQFGSKPFELEVERCFCLDHIFGFLFFLLV